MPRYFTRDEAERVLPKVEQLLREALYSKSEYQESDEEIKSTVREVMVRGGMAVNSDRMQEIGRRRDTAATRLQSAMEAVQEHGCLVKDLDTGLLDFPTLYQGEEVYLCWRLGEPRIEFWHGIHEGFRGRKAIDDEFLAEHGGE